MVVKKELLTKLRSLDAASISDAMDKIGIKAGLLGLKPVNPGNVICGQAFTVKYEACGEIKGTVGDFLDDVDEGQVVVIDNAGRDYCTVWGDIMTYYAKMKNVEGTIIDGVCRDIPEIRRLNYPIFSKGYYMVTGKDRVQVESVNQPVTISNVRVRPGDIIFGDNTGVVVIPYDRVEDIIEITEMIEEKERLIREALDEGKSLKQAREEMGYHNLQTKS